MIYTMVMLCCLGTYDEGYKSVKDIVAIRIEEKAIKAAKVNSGQNYPGQKVVLPIPNEDPIYVYISNCKPCKKMQNEVSDTRIKWIYEIPNEIKMLPTTIYKKHTYVGYYNKPSWEKFIKENEND